MMTDNTPNNWDNIPKFYPMSRGVVTIHVSMICGITAGKMNGVQVMFQLRSDALAKINN
jgi:hypothetical protein